MRDRDAHGCPGKRRAERRRQDRDRHFNWQNAASSPQTVSPYGHTPYGAANTLNRQFAKPLAQGFGFNPSQGFENRLSEAQGPLADYIRNARALFPSLYSDAQRAGQDIAARAPGAFASFQDQIQHFLSGLPQLQGYATNAATQANNALNQAFSPIQSQALYQNAYRDALQNAQQGAAGRGLLDSGSQQGMEEDLSRQLAAQFAEQRFGQQQQAIQGAQGAAGGAAALGQAGIGPAQAYLQALPGYAQLLQSGSQIPNQALAQIFAMMQGANNPLMAILQATSPTVAQKQQSFGFGFL